ncbi:MAG: helix-turn-helix transcriptional regulator [Lachnospiraceae bacterium]|nr:helix-turn-helix transcriptional regulator [Lachnospiraceae bacterium]
MAKSKHPLEFRYYTIPAGDYVMSLLGEAWEREYGFDTGNTLHFHNYLEIGYCYNGSGRFVFEDETLRYTGGMFTIIPAYIPHTTISDPGHICKWEFLYIDMDEFIKKRMQMNSVFGEHVISAINKRGRLLAADNNKRLDSIIRFIIEECREERPYFKESVNGQVYSFVIELLRLEGEYSQKSLDTKANETIKTVFMYVKDHMHEDIKVADMADACGLSETHFRRSFESAMNMKPADYVNYVRVDEACRLISTKELSMEEIAIRVGFQSQSTFNRNFKRITHMTPYQWKLDARNNNHEFPAYGISALQGWKF